MMFRLTLAAAGLGLVLVAPSAAEACTRILYTASATPPAETEKENETPVTLKDCEPPTEDTPVGFTGRSMDWYQDTETDLWAFPRGMQRTGGDVDDPITWTSSYGSVIASGFDIATADGINDQGLVANFLYLSEADYGDRDGKPGLSVGAWAQYALDNYASVDDAVEGLAAEPFRIVAPNLPDGHAATGHLSLSDASGDSAILEYIDGALVIHHDRTRTVMTNSPTFDKQLAITTYWEEIGGWAMLPGTSRPADRFARANFYVNTVPACSNPRIAASIVLSMMRNVSVPLGIADAEKPNVASTLWRTAADQRALRYYFDSATSPDVFWVDLDKLDLSEGASVRKLELQGGVVLSGEASAGFVPADPFPWLAPKTEEDGKQS